jgi:hypothetical protein
VDVSGLLKAARMTSASSWPPLRSIIRPGVHFRIHADLNRKYGVRFEPQDMDKIRPEAAGLLGRIRLIQATQPTQAAR